MKVKAYETGEINYLDDNDSVIGRGFMTVSNTIALTQCPKCGVENYHSNVMHGLCAWCGFDANEGEE